MVKKNIVKEKMKDDKPTFGIFYHIGHPDVVEIMATIGFDWIMFDTEHGPLEISNVQMLMQAMGNTETTPLVRVTWNEPWMIKRALDIGTQGVLVPWVNNKEEAEKVVKSCRYPPYGIRGFGPRRCIMYGLQADGYVQNADKELLIAVQCETRESVENIEDIVSVDGIDLVFIGQSDLSVSLTGLDGKRDPVSNKRIFPLETHEAVKKVLKACKNAGVPCGCNSSPESVEDDLSKGFLFCSLSTPDNFLRIGALRALETAKKATSNLGLGQKIK